MIVCLFGHTDRGSAALQELLDAGVPRASISVIGDLGQAAGLPEAERHVTFDTIHLPVAERELFMDTIRSGGGVLAADGDTELEAIGHRHGASKVLRTSPSGSNPSHNAAG